MNAEELKAEILRNNLTIPKLAKIIGIDKQTLYCKMRGESSFTQLEISKIYKALNLNAVRLCEIFFSELVS